MEWNLDKSRPIRPQICEKLSAGIAAGEFAPGARLMSVREAALAAGVNPNTVQKSFEELERRGVIYSVRGSGWFVSEDTSQAASDVEKLINEKTASYFDDMARLGMSPGETKKYVEEWKI